jgi:hypothetical protein
MGRLRGRIPWLRKLGALWKALEVTDTVLGWWERVPRLGRHLIGFALSWVLFSFGWATLSALANYGTRNWPVVLLIGFTVAVLTWAVIEALRYRFMQRSAIASQPEPETKVAEPGEEVGVATTAQGDGGISERVYLPDHVVKDREVILTLGRVSGEFPISLVCVVTDPLGVSAKCNLLGDMGYMSVTKKQILIYPTDFPGARFPLPGAYRVSWVEVTTDREGRLVPDEVIIASDSFTYFD